MTNLHAHYDQLTQDEVDWIDGIFAEMLATPLGQDGRPPLAADDRIERAVDALARAVIESRDSEAASAALAKDILA